VPNLTPPRLASLAAAVAPLDATAAAAARTELDRKTKPRGSLGRLETLAVQLAAVRGTLSLASLPAAVLVAAADHGYAAAGVSAYPQEVTRQMLRNFAAGGAAVSVLTHAVGARLEIVDVGVVDGDAHPSLRSMRIAAGTRNAAEGPAMTADEGWAAVEAGAAIATELADADVAVLALGDMGIGNTTAASALAAALLAVPPDEVCGPGTGLDDAGISRKIETVTRALRVNAAAMDDPFKTLTAVGGLEIAFLVGVILAGAAARLVLVLDGFIVGAAALVAARVAPASAGYMVAAHVSPEPGHRLLLNDLGLTPLLDWQLRLGEASGATLVLPLLKQAGAILADMATFEGAGVSDSGR
jgi:nicotinate-nucleotide--dimethylbenzimidazole phosphoribosyltransferase